MRRCCRSDVKYQLYQGAPHWRRLVNFPRVDSEKSDRARGWLTKSKDPSFPDRPFARQYARDLLASACGDVLVFRRLRVGTAVDGGQVYGPRADAKEWLACDPVPLP